jgi:DNA polymerase-1
MVIDGLSLAYRMIFKRGRRLTSPDGKATHGVYGFTREMMGLAARHDPDYYVVAWDSPRDQYERRRLFEGYKAARPKASESGGTDVVWQLNKIRDVVKAMDVPLLIHAGWEADDIIATLSKWCRRRRINTTIVGVDKDLHQLVGKRVRIWNPKTDTFTGSREVRRKWGVERCKQVIEIQTLAGDSTDGIPGVKGIGIGKATKLIEEYGTVAELLENADGLTPAVQRALADFDAELGRQLVELNQDLPLQTTLKALRFERFNMPQARPLFRELGFKSLMGG